MKNRTQNKKQNLKAYKGITLIALVVTIIVLLILAAISITAVFGEDGLITRADKAKTKTEEGLANDILAIDNLGSQLDDIVNGPATIQGLIEKESEYNKTVIDKYKNKIVVPAGFKIVAHGTGSGNNIVEYTYDKQDGTSTNIPVVQDGIVIKNVTDGNEFVWVPVGEIKNDAVENTTNKTTITLGRYSNFTIAEDGTLPTPVQVASKTAYDTPTPILFEGNKHIEISSDFEETKIGETTFSAASSFRNTKLAKDNLEEWISKTIDNGGYYIARFEASKNGIKAASKVSKEIPATSSTIITDEMLWCNITQPNAATASRAMYPNSAGAKYYSDLINSYAWDTAIIFIEKYSGDTTYASKKGTEINTAPANTGENTDKKCNIQDMAGNVREWTTETSMDSDKSCTIRGGIWNSSLSWTGSRWYYDTLYSRNFLSFRTSLCVK